MKKENNTNQKEIIKKMLIRLNQISEGLSEKVEYSDNPYLRVKENLNLNVDAWNTKECQDMYKNFIELAARFKIVRCNVRGLAKQMAINCYIQNIAPNLENFKTTAACQQ